MSKMQYDRTQKSDKIQERNFGQKFMNLQHMQYIVEIQKWGSINLAAQKLYISQPYLSNVVKEIEKEMQVTIFERTKQGVKLTARGQECIIQMKNILAQVDVLNDICRGNEDSMRYFTLSMTRCTHVEEAFISLCDEYSACDRGHKIRFFLDEGNTEQVIDDVYRNRADIGVIVFNHLQKDSILKSIRNKQMKYVSLVTSKPHLTMPKDHPAIKKDGSIDLEMLKKSAFVRYIDGFENYMHQIKINGETLDLNTLDKTIYVHGRASLMHLISHDKFFTIGFNSFEMQESFYGVISVPLPETPVIVEFGYILPKDTVTGKITTRFLKHLNETLSGTPIEYEEAVNA